ncbi:hypothetical protein GF367_02310, partial [Candidatus Woesearchaeota archaeon]|nr:hypothetical protein [Candidatus Woesearchaeota archaeon]
MKTKIFLSTLILLFLISPLVNAALPPTTVYKTKANYNDLVPIGLSEDNSRIMSYPGPGDVYYNGKLAYPTELSQGYLLDNRGVGPNSAFLDITYEEYSQLDEIPSHEEFFDMIKDYNPFLEMYDCGNRYGDEIEGLNTIINQGKLNKECVSLLDQSGPTPTEPPVAVKEQVKCVFDNSNEMQKCYTAEDNSRFSCSGSETCVMDVNGKKGEELTWKSTCGGYAYTITDGENEYAEFDCLPEGNTTTEIIGGREFRYAYWQCYSGEEEKQGSESSCKSSETWQSYAEEFCQDE